MRLTFSTLSRVLCLALCGLVGWAYLWQLDRQPLWWDEGGSFYASAFLSPTDSLSLAATTDDHPPGYYGLLYLWLKLTGPHPFTARLFSAGAGILLIPLMYACGRKLSGPGGGLLAAWLTAVSPFIAQHAREVRMYPLGLLCVTAATYFWLALITRPARWCADRPTGLLLGGYALAVIGGLYTHYACALAFAAQGVAVLIAGLQKKTPWRYWLALVPLIGLAYLPWLIYTAPRLPALLGSNLGRASSGAGFRWDVFILSLQQLLVRGGSSYDLLNLTAVSLIFVLALWGLVARLRQPAVLVALGLPVALALALALYLHRDIPLPALLDLVARQLFFALPALLLLAALGLRRLWPPAAAPRWLWALPALPGLYLVCICLRSFPGLYPSAADPANDYRPLIAAVRRLARPGDLILTAYTWQDGYFAAYAPGLPVSFRRNASVAETAGPFLEEAFAAHTRVWVINYRADIHYASEPFNIWLMQNAALAFSGDYGASQAALFVRPGPAPSQWPAHTDFTNGISVAYQPISTSLTAGAGLSLDLQWQTAALLSANYIGFIHLGEPAAAPVAQSDGVPTGGLNPTYRWPIQQPVLDRRAVLIPLEAPPGRYYVYAGLYDADTGTRLPLTHPANCDVPPDRFCLGQVEITAP